MSVFYPRVGAQLTVAFDGRGAPNKILTIDHVLPREMNVSRNGYHEADTWRAEFDMRELPFDPEGIASIAARLYTWNDNGTAGQEWAVDANERLRGLADEDSIEIDKSRQRLAMSGRDYTAILDPDWDPRKHVPAGVPLDQAVQEIADTAAPATSSARFKIEWKASVPPPLSGGTARSTKKKGLWVKQGKTTWDVIYDLCIQHGFIVFVQDSRIIISDPRSLTKAGLAAVPAIAYGRELISLKVSRRLAKERVPRIKIVYWDAKERQHFTAIYPEKHQVVTIGLGLKKNEDLVIPAPTYCHDRDSALRYAQMRWELMARAESSYVFKTRHLTVPTSGRTQGSAPAVPGAEVGDFDLLGLQAGDPVAIHFDPFNQEQMRALDIGERESFLESLGYHPKIAAFVAANIERIEQFKQPYYVRKATYDYSHDNGLEIEVEAVNFAYERREIMWADGQIPPGGVDAISGDSLPPSGGSTADPS